MNTELQTRQVLIVEDKESAASETIASAIDRLIQALEDKLREKGFRDVERSPLGIMVTSTTGPNALGVIFRGAPRA